MWYISLLCKRFNSVCLCASCLFCKIFKKKFILLFIPHIYVSVRPEEGVRFPYSWSPRGAAQLGPWQSSTCFWMVPRVCFHKTSWPALIFPPAGKRGLSLLLLSANIVLTEGVGNFLSWFFLLKLWEFDSDFSLTVWWNLPVDQPYPGIFFAKKVYSC